MKSHALAMFAGCLGAMASATGKLGMSGDEVAKFCASVTKMLFYATNSGAEFELSEDEIFITYVATVTIRIALLMVTVMLNAVMWTTFVQSMQRLNSGEAAVLNTGTNIVVSAFLGTLVFGETLGTLWWLGASFILAGMAIIQTSKREDSSEETVGPKGEIKKKSVDSKPESMLAAGICPRCVMRFLNIQNNELLQKAESEIEKELQKNWPSLMKVKKKDEHLSKTDAPSEGDGKSGGVKKLCHACLGMAQDECLQKWLEPITKMVRSEKFIFENFKITVSQPVQLLVLEEHLVRLWKDDLRPFKKAGRPLEIKDVLKIILEPRLEKELQAKATTKLEGELLISLSFKHNESELELLPKVEELVPECFVHAKKQIEYASRKRARQDLTIYTLNSMRPAVQKLKHEDLLMMVGEERYSSSMSLDDIKLTRAPIYVAGRYCKFSRDLSQTPWYIDGKRKTNKSVQEFIADPIKLSFSSDSYNFSSSGREDIDVRMLGRGRPFLVELANPREFSAHPEDMMKLRQQINSATDEISVRDLQVVSKSDSKKLKDGEEEKTKAYTAVCYVRVSKHDPKIDDSAVFEGKCKEMKQYIRDLSNIKNLKIEQKTPLRVLHRRNLAVRERYIHRVSAEIIDVTNAAKIVSLPKSIPEEYIFFKLELTTQAGTYIKEFVHGDFGRTVPHVGMLLGTEADILSLDVNAVNLDWPPTVCDKDV